MELFIRIKDGQPFEHPIFSDNFCQAFPDVNTNNLPPEFAKFVRLEIPSFGIYEVYEGATYVWQNGVVTDFHNIRAMTLEEKTERQNFVKLDWAESGYPSWVFDEATCSFKPPTARPTDEKLYKWNELSTSWVELTNV
jgi:hypothetical protein